MRHPDSTAAEGARAAIASLQQSVLGWMDADRVLPVDGSALLAALERAREGHERSGGSEDHSAATAGIDAFIRRVEALIDAGAIEAAEGRQPLETARALLGARCE